jgi:hypothetical protein
MWRVLVYLGVLAFFIVLAKVRREQARRNVRLLEMGKVCVHCHGLDVTPGEVGITCNTCGQLTSWKLIKQPKLTVAEIEKVSTRDFQNPLYK